MTKLLLGRAHLLLTRRWSAKHGTAVIAGPCADRFRGFSTADTHKRPPIELGKVLVANRGEIALRILRTCRQWEIPTVAVYSSADGPDCRHARGADQAVHLGTGPTPAESYLRQDDFLQICRDLGVRAIHPGYGFLSEQVDFCRKVEAAPGVTWIGPPATAMEQMASKAQAKALMDAAGVSTTPGYYDTSESAQQSADALLDRAHEIGFPVLIKAVLGGGGKGMRLVHEASDFMESLRACQREAQAAFGDGRVLLEKFLTHPRHIEVQILADAYGNVHALHERDCSLQRRHQKIIEEAPATRLDDAIRHELHEQARRAAQAVGYVNAGTVEFLYQDDNFYFCEMNTRLQVEHPVTEAITGLDLVEWQLRVAAGESLADFEVPPVRGHALEARIYAEQPHAGFLPAAGTAWHHQPPKETVQEANFATEGTVRVDTALESGQAVGVFYDPMISKLIVHADDREASLVKLIQALKEYEIAGVSTNIDFLIACAREFQRLEGEMVTTNYLEHHLERILSTMPSKTAPPVAHAIATWMAMNHWQGTLVRTSSPSPWSPMQGSWRLGPERVSRQITVVGDKDSEEEGTLECLSNRDGSFEIVTAPEESFHVEGRLVDPKDPTNFELVVNQTDRMQMTAVFREHKGLWQVRMWPRGAGKDDYCWHVDLRSPTHVEVDSSMTASYGGGLTVAAPMPGRITRVDAKVGDKVEPGQVVVVMEAMKMEHSLRAPSDGVLSEIRCSVGDTVDDGAILLVLEGEEVP